MTPEACGVICLSVLHFGLNSLNALLHISYNQDFQQWSAYSRDPETYKCNVELQVHNMLDNQTLFSSFIYDTLDTNLDLVLTQFLHIFSFLPHL